MQLNNEQTLALIGRQQVQIEYLSKQLQVALRRLEDQEQQGEQKEQATEGDQ